MSGSMKHKYKADRKSHTVRLNHIGDSQKAQCQSENKYVVSILLKDVLLAPKCNRGARNKILLFF